MGKRRRPKPPSRSRITAITVAAGAFGFIPAQAQAAPDSSIDEVRKQVAQLYEEAEAPTEEYNAVLDKRAELQSAAEAIQKSAAKQQAEINELRRSLGTVAAEQYRSGGIDPSVQLFLSGDPDSYLDQATAIDRLSDRQTAMLTELRSKQRELAQQRTEATEKLTALEEVRQELGSKKREIQGKLTEARKLLNSLTAQQRAMVEAAEEKSDQATGSSDSAATYNGPASGRGRTALEFAYAQLGKPYEWGSTGPDSFDCSGLTGAAWRAAGVSLPRTVQQQYAAGRKVAKSDLQPGDIIYWYNSSQHNGMYIGDGKAIHAPRTGKNVEITDLDSMPFFAASRP